MRGIVSVVVQGTASLQKQLEKIAADRRNAAVNALNLGAYQIHAWIVADMNQAKSGISSVKGVGSHTASAPGESPARDTGELVRKLVVSPAKKSDTDPEARVISAAEYASDLEFGTKHMAARPYMRPAFAANIKEIRAAIRSALKG